MENREIKLPQEAKNTGDITSAIISDIEKIKADEDRLQGEKSERQRRGDEEYLKWLRNEHKEAVEIINDPNWIGIDDIEKYKPEIPEGVFILVRHTEGRHRINSNLSQRDLITPIETTEVKFIKAEQQKLFKDVIPSNPEWLKKIGVKVHYFDNNGPYDDTSLDYTYEVKQSIQDVTSKNP